MLIYLNYFPHIRHSSLEKQIQLDKEFFPVIVDTDKFQVEQSAQKEHRILLQGWAKKPSLAGLTEDEVRKGQTAILFLFRSSSILLRHTAERPLCLTGLQI